MSKAVCTECRYIYNSRFGCEENGVPAGTPFLHVDETTFFCPHCESSKDAFVEVFDEIVEISDPEDMADIESEHIPVYFFEEEELVVHIGTDHEEHPQEDEHYIEWIMLRDGQGEILDRQFFLPGEDVEARFSIDEDEDFEVLASCTEHGIWKGFFYGDIGV